VRDDGGLSSFTSCCSHLLSLTPRPADVIAAVQFNHDGEYLATGDKGGRVVLFERSNEPHVRLVQPSRNAVSLALALQSAEYRFYTEFQSHEPEFDYLKSLEIEEKINQIRWIRRTSV